jgi:hypothetical protein
MGISANKSSFLLHRIQNGELPSELNVSLVWVLIGTNDIADGCNPDKIVAAKIIVVKEIMRRQPKVKLSSIPSLSAWIQASTLFLSSIQN